MGDREIQIVDVVLEIDGLVVIILLYVEKQWFYMVVGGEFFIEDLELKSLFDVDYRNFMWFKGKKLYDYVKF